VIHKEISHLREFVIMARTADCAEMVVRLPRDVKSWLEKEAARTLASQNSEIVRSIRAWTNDPEQQARSRA